MAKNSVIPTGAEPLDFARGRLREAKWRDLFCGSGDKMRSLDYAALRAASLGMTGKIVICDCPPFEGAWS